MTPAPKLIEPGPGVAEKLAVLHGSAFAEFWGRQAFADLLAQPGVFGLTAGSGFILCRLVLDEAEIVTLAVTPSARRQGVGQGLVEAATALLVQLGAATLFLEVSADNPAARALYEKLGFTRVGLRKAYYADGSDALVMRLNLNS